MFIKYTLSEQILLPAEQYTSQPTKSLRNHLFQKYLYKILRLPSSSSTQKPSSALCIKIQSITQTDNIILRKSADLKVRVIITIIVLRLMEGEFYEGVVKDCDGRGIVVGFVGGLLEGRLEIKGLHRDTIYVEQENKWVLAAGDGSNQGYQWKIGAKVRFRIAYTLWDQVYEGPEEEGPAMADLIQLKADQPGLGPVDWWI